MNKVCKYKKRPIVIEAIQWDGTNATYLEIEKFMDNSKDLIVEIDDHLWVADVGVPYVSKMSIRTIDGTFEVQEGDFIIKGIEGEFYCCKPSIFFKTYKKKLFNIKNKKTKNSRKESK